jgi:hypothetical protein
MVAPSSGIFHERIDFDQEASFSVSQAKKPTNKKRGRSVKFCKSIHIRMIPSISQLSKDEIQDYYLTKNDKKRIRGEIKVCLKRMAQKNLRTEEDDELRGLESYTPQAYSARIQRMRLALHAVLMQQTSGPLTNEWLSQIYRNFTESSANTAYIRGLMDQQMQNAAPPFKQIMIR